MTNTVEPATPRKKYGLPMTQCQGITARGRRCKLNASEHEFCKFHFTPRAGSHDVRDAAGFIYIYKLARPQARAEVKCPKTNKTYRLNPSKLQKFLSLFSKPRRNLAKKELIKVGYTTKEPAKRVAEWEQQCGHQLCLIAPRYKAGNCDIEKKGWPTSQAHAAEQRIHAYLRSQYGGGKLNCSQCLHKGKTGIHLEWFLVPKEHLPQIFIFIDNTI